MMNNKKFIVSHAPFFHNGSKISSRSYNTIAATLPAVSLPEARPLPRQSRIPYFSR